MPARTSTSAGASRPTATCFCPRSTGVTLTLVGSRHGVQRGRPRPVVERPGGQRRRLHRQRQGPRTRPPADYAESAGRPRAASPACRPRSGLRHADAERAQPTGRRSRPERVLQEPAPQRPDRREVPEPAAGVAGRLADRLDPAAARRSRRPDPGERQRGRRSSASAISIRFCRQRTEPADPAVGHAAEITSLPTVDGHGCRCRSTDSPASRRGCPVSTGRYTVRRRPGRLAAIPRQRHPLPVPSTAAGRCTTADTSTTDASSIGPPAFRPTSMAGRQLITVARHEKRRLHRPNRHDLHWVACPHRAARPPAIRGDTRNRAVRTGFVNATAHDHARRTLERAARQHTINVAEHRGVCSGVVLDARRQTAEHSPAPDTRADPTTHNVHRAAGGRRPRIVDASPLALSKPRERAEPRLHQDRDAGPTPTPAGLDRRDDGDLEPGDFRSGEQCPGAARSLRPDAERGHQAAAPEGHTNALRQPAASVRSRQRQQQHQHERLLAQRAVRHARGELPRRRVSLRPITT